MARRCFEYNFRLILHYQAVVHTTVAYFLPGADRGAQAAYRLYDKNTLLKVLGKDRIMQPYLWQWGVEDGQAKGRREPPGRSAPTSRRRCTPASRNASSPRS